MFILIKSTCNILDIVHLQMKIILFDLIIRNIQNAINCFTTKIIVKRKHILRLYITVQV